jgi:hypothetical protein
MGYRLKASRLLIIKEVTPFKRCAESLCAARRHLLGKHVRRRAGQSDVQGRARNRDWADFVLQSPAPSWVLCVCMVSRRLVSGASGRLCRVRAKLECPLESGTGTARLKKRTRIVTSSYSMVISTRRVRTYQIKNVLGAFNPRYDLIRAAHLGTPLVCRAALTAIQLHRIDGGAPRELPL